MGAALAHAGPDALNFAGIVNKVLLPLVLSPLAGFGVGFLIMWLIYWIFARVMRSKVNRIFRKMQLVSAAFMATSHGLNDAQKTMGIITLALFIFGEIDEVAVPLWVKLACAMAMAAGTAIGGWKIVKTMGHRIFKLEPVHGFAAETSAALVISGASVLGAPVSTTHTISACIFGVGSTCLLYTSRTPRAAFLVSWGPARPRSVRAVPLCAKPWKASSARSAAMSGWNGRPWAVRKRPVALPKRCPLPPARKAWPLRPRPPRKMHARLSLIHIYRRTEISFD